MIKHPLFALPERKVLLKSDIAEELLLIDVTETAIERPKKKQKYFYSGKKKKHTLKNQLVVNKTTKKIICSSFSNGRKHNFRIFKESKIKFYVETYLLADGGYQGLLHARTQMPKRKTKSSNQRR